MAIRTEFSPHSPHKARTACTPHEFRHKKGHTMDQAHGSPFDRGSADSWYRRQAIPHYMINGARIEEVDMTAAQIAEYEAGYEDNEKQTDSRKDYA